MNLNESQKMKVSAWIAEGLKLADIQKRIASEFSLNPTYMEVRFLVDDLKLTPKDPEPIKPVEKIPPPTVVAEATSATGVGTSSGTTPGIAGVTVSVDQLARPGAAVSGSVTFSDGKDAVWYIDQLGRPGLIPKQAGYKPSPADLQQFQVAWEAELTKLGM